MDDHTHDPIRELATDTATDAVPLELTPARTDFNEWRKPVDFVRGSIIAALRSEVPA